MSSKTRSYREPAKILVAEDSPTQAEQLAYLLEQTGYKVTVARNGKEALAATQKSRPDIVISDIVMPEMDGYALCRQIKAKKALKDIPVILLTSLSGVQDVIKGLECGADSFIRKPYDEKYLLSRVNYTLINRELRKGTRVQAGLEVVLGGQKHFITSEREQIMDLLVSIYEEAVQMNGELAQKQQDLSRSYQSLNGLYRIAENLNGSISEKDIAEKALDSALQLPGVQAGWLLLRADELRFRVAAARNLPPGLTESEITEGDCVCRRKLLGGQYSHSAEILECERLQALNGMADGLRYHAAIPLWAGPKTLGVLDLVGADKGMFSQEDLKILHGVGNQIGVALERAELYSDLEKKVQERTAALRKEVAERMRAQEEVQRNLERIRALHEIDLAITSTLDLKTILDVLLEKIDLFFPRHAASTVRLLNPRTGELKPVTCRNIDEVEWRSRKGGRGFVKIVFDTGAPLAVRDIESDSRTIDPVIFLKRGLHSYLGVPLRAMGKVIGVLSVYTNEKYEFSNDEIEFLATLAGQAAIAIHNAQLYEAAESSRKELELTNQYLERSLRQLSGLYAALTPLAPAGSVHQMMDGIIDRLLEATGADAALIRIWDNATGALAITSQRGFADHYLKSVDTIAPGAAGDRVYRTGEIIIAPDIAADPRLKGKVQLQEGLRSCAMLPLKSHNEMRGIIHLSSRKLGYFDEEQRDHLMAIARQMGIALENKELFDNLKESRDELQKANKVKDEFLSVMSHELRTPLNVVVGYAGMIRDGMLGEVNPQQAEALDKVIRRTNDQLTLVNNILFATVLESDGVTTEIHDFSLEDFLDQLKLGYETPINKELSFNWDYPLGLPMIRTDSAKLKHILQNLLDNAIKFTGKGSITIFARVVSASPTPRVSASAGEDRGRRGRGDTGQWVEFKVADTGAGIPREHLPFIFDKFRQVDSSETRLYGGAGMGLYIVKRFAELMSGTVEVESEVGKGSTFTVRIPVEF